MVLLISSCFSCCLFFSPSGPPVPHEPPPSVLYHACQFALLLSSCALLPCFLLSSRSSACTVNQQVSRKGVQGKVAGWQVHFGSCAGKARMCQTVGCGDRCLCAQSRLARLSTSHSVLASGAPALGALKACTLPLSAPAMGSSITLSRVGWRLASAARSAACQAGRQE